MTASRVLAPLAALAFLSPGFAMAQPISPSPSSVPGAGSDPFCDQYVSAIPWSLATKSPSSDAASDALMVAVFSNSATPARTTTNIILISDTGAYDASLRDVPLVPRRDATAKYDSGTGSPTLIVTLPEKVALKYAFVDSFSRDGGVNVSCPTEPTAVSVYGKPLRLNPPDTRLPSFSARFKQQLPALLCGKQFSAATVTHAFNPEGLLTSKKYSVEIEIFLDANGNLVKESIYKSSGIEYADTSALAAAERSTYSPATFLCTPIVSKYLFRVDYGP